MKLQDFLIGIGLFALFTVIIFGAINNNGGDCEGIYCPNYLNFTHNANTSKAIGNISNVGTKTDTEFQEISGDIGDFSSETEEPTESSLVGSALKILINLPKSYKPVVNILRMMEEQFHIPSQFTQWVIGSIIIIIILMFIAAFLKNKLQS